ncbi:MAG: hypothetical protein R3264_18695, partial [Anaerolineae bacterium]|nr:hypothetical protein [Anaerolineae bacterium]
MKIVLEPNDQEGRDKIPYHIFLELIPYRTSSYETQFQVPVRYQATASGDLYSVDLCGIRLESNDPNDLL